MSSAARRAYLLAASLALLTLRVAARPGDLEEVFRRPPEAARPWVFWYWMHASVSRAGITADLEAMKEVGIGGAYLMPIKGATQPPLLDPPVEQLSPAWWGMVRFAMQEADRLGLKLAMHACDGFATAGGPWITPALSMQKVVWTETQVDGGHPVDAMLDRPQAYEGYYRDIAVLAFPATEGAGVSTRTAVPTVTTSEPGAAPQFLPGGTSSEVFVSNKSCWIQYAFAEPFTCRAVTVRVPATSGIQANTYFANRLTIEVSDDGGHFRTIGRLEPPRHGWQDGDTVTHAIPAVTARYFRFAYDPAGAEAGVEDLDSAKWNPVLRIQAIGLSGATRLHQFEGKTGEVWRVSRRSSAAQVPGVACVSLTQIRNISDHVDANGRLVWDPPPGRWTVLRVGHTSTGSTNYAGGGGVGLECDKFNAAAVRLQFDRWFGEAIRQAGPELAGRVLKVFHIDSWECGSQNWSPVFREEFTRRRGYDLLPYLPAMAGIPVQSADVSERFLHDVRETIAELVVDNFCGTMSELARAHGCTFSAESIAPTMTSDGTAYFASIDLPMGEFWLRSPTHDKLNDILDAVSGAHIYGKPVVQSEAFTELRMSWDETPALLKALGDRNYCFGINRFVYHVFVHNPWIDRKPGMTLGRTGHFFQRDQTWWRPGRAWVEYAQRCQALLQEGRPAVDVAVFTGDAVPRRAVVPWELAEWTLPGFFATNDPRRAKRIIEAGDWIDPLHGYAYDSINRDVLLRLARVRDGRIELPGGASYGLLVLPGPRPLSPDPELMSPEVAARLRELVEAGATLLMCVEPQQSPSLQDYPACDVSVHRAAVALMSRTTDSLRNSDGIAMWRVGKGRVVAGPFHKDSFDALGLGRDVIAKDPSGRRDAGIAWTHRAAPGMDLYFLSNQRDEARVIEVSLRVAGRVPELWDPLDGSICQASTWRVENTRTILPVRLEPSGSLFIVLREPTASQGGNAGPNWIEPRTVLRLDGAWQVAFESAMGGPAEPVMFEQLADWTQRPESGVRYYSGTAVYSRSFEWRTAARKQPRVWLDLGRVANLAEVTVNGTPCGIAWTAPYRVEITAALRSGENQLRIAVTNTWANRLTGDQALPEARRLTWTTAPARPGGSPLLEAGLLGPVIVGTE
jgi:hypothetical protein